MLNNTFVIPLQDREFKANSLSLFSINELFQAMNQKKHMAQIKELAATMSPAERNRFLLDAMAKMPKEYDLTEIIQDNIATLGGIIAILKKAILECKENTIAEAELDALLKSTIGMHNVADYINYAVEIIGLNVRVEDVEVDGKKNEM